MKDGLGDRMKSNYEDRYRPLTKEELKEKYGR